VVLSICQRRWFLHGLLLVVLPGAVATNASNSFQSAVSRPMSAGVYYANLTLLTQDGGYVYVGVVGAGHDAVGGLHAHYSVEGWLLGTGGGALTHANDFSNWEGMPLVGEVKAGDVVGLMLDLGQRTLSVYLNGSRRGVMVAPGMKAEDGEAVGELSAPLRWAVDVAGGASVRIEHGPRPPPPTEAEVAAAVAWNDTNYRG
jgi:hypothetical protein